jgi:DNA-binding YbaB/EbfC family protein
MTFPIQEPLDMPQPPNIQKMLAQAQEMMAAQQQAQEQLKEQEVEASAGGGMVKVKLSGDMQIKSLKIDPDAVDPEDVEMLEDLVLAAINEGLRQAGQLAEQAMGDSGGGADFDPMAALESLGLGGPGGPAGAPPMNRAQRRAAQRKG